MPFARQTSLPENPFARFVPDQIFAIIPEFTLLSGHTMKNVPIAYKTWGVLNEARDNVMLICHPLSRSVDVDDWWSTIMSPEKTIDATRFFVICLNVLGSPYGSASPLTINPETQTRYGPDFPMATVRDDVRIHKLVLDDLGIQSIAICLGGSMGGFHVFEWAFYGSDYVKALIPISAPAQSSSWSMGWNEAQRQAIFADPKYQEGYYPLEEPPLQGMTSARMTAMLTYRGRNSYERRFGRNVMVPSKTSTISETNTTDVATLAKVHHQLHNAGHPNMASKSNGNDCSNGTASPSTPTPGTTSPISKTHQTQAANVPLFAAHSYLRYQASKFNERFDANCYIAISRKLDAHDISADRGDYLEVVKTIKQPTLLLGISSDVLYPLTEIQELGSHLPRSKVVTVDSEEGHDGFLLEHDQVNEAILAFMKTLPHLCEIQGQEGVPLPDVQPGKKAGLFSNW